MAYNHVTLVGRLAADPELRRTGSGKAVTSFRLAVDRPTQEKITDWLEIVAWEHKAEFAARNFKRGQEVLVDGELQTRSWTDKDGNKRNTVEVKANVLRFVGGRQAQEQEPQQQEQGGFQPIDDDDENLPF
jgi:single-strand DNA-binding protein